LYLIIFVPSILLFLSHWHSAFKPHWGILVFL